MTENWFIKKLQDKLISWIESKEMKGKLQTKRGYKIIMCQERL